MYLRFSQKPVLMLQLLSCKFSYLVEFGLGLRGIIYQPPRIRNIHLVSPKLLLVVWNSSWGWKADSLVPARATDFVTHCRRL